MFPSCTVSKEVHFLHAPLFFLLAIILKYGFPISGMSFVVSSIVEVYVNNIALWIVHVKMIGQPNKRSLLAMFCDKGVHNI